MAAAFAREVEECKALPVTLQNSFFIHGVLLNSAC